MTTAAQLMVKIGADAREAMQAFRQVDQGIGNMAQSAGVHLSSVGEGIGNLGRKATLMTLPLAAGMGVAIAKAAEFESQMNILEITMRESGTTAEQWSDVALKIGADSELVGVSASEAATAITNFGLAGLDTTQILGDMSGYLEGNTSLMGALRAAIDLAAASGMDLEAASQGIVVTMSQYELGFEQASTVMDNFVRTADSSTASVEDLLAAQSNVGPILHGMGQSVEVVNLQLAMLADYGIAGAEAGTALKSMWMNLTSPTTKASDALADLGISLYDTNGGMRDAQSIIGELSGKMAGMTDEQRNMYGQMLAGSYGIKAFNVLLGEGSEGWEEYETAIAGATSMQEQAAARTQGFEGAMEQFKSVLETFMITAAMPFIRDFLTPFLRKAADFIQKLMEVHPQFAKWTMVIGALIVVVGPLLMFIGSMISAIGTIVTVIGGAIGFFGGLGGAIAGVAAAIGVSLGPVLLIIAAIALAVLALKVAWETNFLGIRDIAQGVWDSIKAIFSFIKGTVENFMAFLNGEITWDEFVDKTKQSFENLKTFLARIWIDVVNKIREKWEEAKQVIVEKLAEFIAPLVGGMDKAREIVTTAFERIGAFFAAHWENLKTMAAGAWEFIKGIIAGAVEIIRGIVAFAMQIISGDWEGAWNTIKATVTRVWDEIKAGISSAMEVIGPKLKSAWEDIKTAVTEKVETLKTAVAEKWEQMKSGTVEKWEAVKERVSIIVTAIKDFVVNTIGGLVEKAIELFGQLMGALTGGGEAGGATPFTIDFSVLIASLLNLRENWTLTLTHTTNTLAQMLAVVQVQFAAMQTFIVATNTAIYETTTATWYLLRDALALIWLELQMLYTVWGQTMVTVTSATWVAVYETTVTQWTLQRDWLELTWRNLLALYNEIMLAMLASTRQGLQWIFQENERTWPLIVGKWTDGLNQMRANTEETMAAVASVVSGTLNGLAGTAHGAGAALGNAFADGIRSSIGAIEAAAQAAAAAARRYLPGSDAETGPLSDLTASGRALPETLAKGMRGGISEIVNAANVLATAMRPPYVTRPYEAANTFASALGKIKPKLPPYITRPFEAANAFGKNKPKPPAYATRPAIPALTPAYATRPYEPAPTPRPGTAGFGGQGSGKPAQCITINIYNPTGSPSEASIMHALKQLAAVGVLQPIAVN